MVIKMLFDPAHCYVTARLMLMELFILMGPFYDFMNSEFISIANIIHCLFLEYWTALCIQAFIFTFLRT
jgi:hypothetical protein